MKLVQLIIAHYCCLAFAPVSTLPLPCLCFVLPFAVAPSALASLLCLLFCFVIFVTIVLLYVAHTRCNQVHNMQCKCAYNLFLALHTYFATLVFKAKTNYLCGRTVYGLHWRW